MSNVTQKTNSPHLSCIDIYGNQLMVSRGKKGKINFTLYHDEVAEGTARKEFADMSLRITEESGNIYGMIQGLYEMRGNTFVSSEDPIRDGRNFLFLEQYGSDYYMTIGRDLANDLNSPNKTNIEISGKTYEDLLIEATEPKKQYVKRKELSQ